MSGKRYTRFIARRRRNIDLSGAVFFDGHWYVYVSTQSGPNVPIGEGTARFHVCDELHREREKHYRRNPWNRPIGITP